MSFPRKPAGKVAEPSWFDAEVAPPSRLRRFDGAVTDRLSASWLTTNASIERELRDDLDKLRARCRDLAKNNEYAAKFLKMVRNNLVGPEGFTLQSRVVDDSGAADRGACEAMERAWWRWMRPENADVTGRQSFHDICRSAVMDLARDGEFLLREVVGAAAGNPFGYALQHIDVDHIDTTHNVDAGRGFNRIVNGVELTPYGRPVALYIFTEHPQHYGAARKRERIPAEQLRHCFVPFHPGQSRGVPWMHAAIMRLNDLNGYRHAAVVAARAGAAKMGFYTTPDGLPPAGAGGTDDKGNFSQQSEPGSFEVVPAGYEFTSYDPTYPHDQFAEFCAETLRGISAGLGVAYPTLSENLSGVNFSSLRGGKLEERDEWMTLQNWMVSALLVGVYENWARFAIVNGQVKLANGSPLPVAKLEKFTAHVWQPRRWAWVDPKKDIEAAVIAIEARLESPQAIAAKAGRDIEDVLDDIAAFYKLAAEKGVSLPDRALPFAPDIPEG